MVFKLTQSPADASIKTFIADREDGAADETLVCLLRHMNAGPECSF